MTTIQSPNEDLVAENEELRWRLEEQGEILRAIRSGEVDALVVSRPEGEQVYTLQGAEHPYRVLVESMNEGAVTLDGDGTIVYGNRRLAEMLQVPLEKLIGSPLHLFVAPMDQALFASRLADCGAAPDKEEISLTTGTGGELPVLFSCSCVEVSGGAVVSVMLTDISSRKQTERTILRLNRLYAMLSATNHAIVHARDREAIFREFCRCAVESGGFLLSWVGLVDRESGRIEIAAAQGRVGYLGSARIPATSPSEELGPTTKAIAEASYYVCNDFACDDLTRSWHKRPQAHGLHASASIAITEGHEVIGALTVYAGERDFFDRQQVELLQQLGSDVSFSLDKLLLEERVREAEVRGRIAAERAQAAELLRESEERFKVLSSATFEGIVISAEGRIRDVNEQFLDIAGYQLEEMVGMAVQDLLPPEERERVLASLGEGGASKIEHGLIRKDGARLVVDAKGRNIIYKGRPVRITAVQDITERKRAQRELQELNERLEHRVDERTAELAANMEKLKAETEERILAVEELRKNEQLLIQQTRLAALGEMIGNIAHQWRQPLNSLGLLIQQPPLFYELGEVDQEFLEKNVQKSMELIRHMSRTIDDFRNFFKPDKEKVFFKVKEEVSKTLSLMDGGLDDVEIVVEAQSDRYVFGFPNEFSQVLLNILSNAKDALNERSVPLPKVSITIGEQEERTVVTITDNAGGIAEDVIGKIFDPYFTTKGPQAGTGVGLFMSKTIIEKNMGGRLWARNVTGGAEFRIEV